MRTHALSATVVLSVLLAALLAGCSAPRRASQVRIGVWAAERDLWDEAIYRWGRALQTNPDSAVAHNNLAVAYEKKGQFAEAKREYELALKISPNHAQIKANFQRFKLAQDVKDDKTTEKKTAREGKDEIR